MCSVASDTQDSLLIPASSSSALEGELESCPSTPLRSSAPSTPFRSGGPSPSQSADDVSIRGEEDVSFGEMIKVGEGKSIDEQSVESLDPGMIRLFYGFNGFNGAPKVIVVAA